MKCMAARSPGCLQEAGKAQRSSHRQCSRSSQLLSLEDVCPLRKPPLGGKGGSALTPTNHDHVGRPGASARRGGGDRPRLTLALLRRECVLWCVAPSAHVCDASRGPGAGVRWFSVRVVSHCVHAHSLSVHSTDGGHGGGAQFGADLGSPGSPLAMGWAQKAGWSCRSPVTFVPSSSCSGTWGCGSGLG